MKKKLVGNQAKLDMNKDGKLSKEDFDMLNKGPNMQGSWIRKHINGAGPNAEGFKAVGKKDGVTKYENQKGDVRYGVSGKKGTVKTLKTKEGKPYKG